MLDRLCRGIGQARHIVAEAFQLALNVDGDNGLVFNDKNSVLVFRHRSESYLSSAIGVGGFVAVSDRYLGRLWRRRSVCVSNPRLSVSFHRGC